MLVDPIWNKPVHESDRAMDPLGMDRTTDRLLNELLNGITTVTPRARYYSFYVWAVHHINKKKSIKTYSQFCNEFYNIERAYMLSCIAHEQKSLIDKRGHNSINGSLKGRRVWSEKDDIISMDFKYFGHRLGGYGQYYEGSISNLGLIKLSDNTNYEQTTDIGIKIAAAFDKVISRTDFMKLLDKKRISKNQLIKLGNKICLCKLKDNDAEDRNLLRNLFFGALSSEGDRSIDVKRRRETLFLILFCSHFASKRGFKLTDQNFLDACYFEQILNDRVYSVKIPSSLLENASFWRVFRAHDYLAYSAEALLTCFLEFLNEKSNIGGKLDEFIQQSSSSDMVNGITNLTGALLPHSSPSKISILQLLNALTIAEGIKPFTENEIEVSKKFNSKVKMSSKISEFNAMRVLEQNVYEEELDPVGVFPITTTLLLTIYMRFLNSHLSGDKAWWWLTKHTANDLSPVRFIDDLYYKIKSESFSLADFQEWFISEYVIKRATNIYLEKSSSSIFSKPRSWFHKEEQYFKRDREYWPNHRNTRFNSAMSILEDLGLMKIADDGIILTEEGEKILCNIASEKL